MKEKTLRKIAPLTVLILLFTSLICVFQLPVTSAITTESTGLKLSNFDNNQDTYVTVGGWDIVACGTKLLFYSVANGNLDKDYIMPTLTGSSTKIATRVQYFNTTHIVVAQCEYMSHWGYADNGAHFASYYLNIATLTPTTIDSEAGYPSSHQYGTVYEFRLFTDSGSTYLITSIQTGATSDDVLLEKIAPTCTGSMSTISTTFTEKLNAPTIITASETANTVYLISASNSGTSRYQVYKLELTTPTYTQIGTSATDNTWGDFCYMYGYSYETVGSSSWTDIGVVYNIKNVTKNQAFAIVRFNDSAVEVNFRATLSVPAPVSKVRPYCVSFSGIWDRVQLREGLYDFFFFSDSYASYGATLCAVTVSSLSTTAPNVTIGYTPVASGDGGTQWTHYYTSSGDIGGLLLPSGNMVMLDYQYEKAICDQWASLNPTYSYIFSLSPSPIHIVTSGSLYRAVCLYNLQYNYLGEVFADSVRVGSGTYTVQTTGLSTDYNIATTGIYGSVSATGVIASGYLNFTLSARTSSYVTIYEGVKVTLYIDGGGTDEITHLFVWTSDVTQDGLPPTTISPTQGIGGTGGTGTGTGGLSLFNTNTFIGLFMVLFFTILLGAYAGRDGIMAGLMLGTFFASIMGFFPIYGLILTVIFGALLIFSHVSGGGGSNSGTPKGEV